jgi:DNA repair photolyase
MRPVANPPNPWQTAHVEYFADVPMAELHVYEEEATEVVNENESPDLGFRWSCNPYRGCFHGCAYCYARPTHQYLGFGAGTDFERRIVVKINAAERLRARLHRPSWPGEIIAFSGVTDCYQPIEASYGLTRACLEVCLEYRNPVGIITKGALIERDADLLGRLAVDASAVVTISMPFADEDLARRMETFAGSPLRRLRAMRRLADAGVHVGVAIAPLIPGLNDDQIPAVLALAKEHGARHAFLSMLRLPGEVEPVFFERLRAAVPLRADKVQHAIEEMRGGGHNDSRFHHRFRGQGPRWQMIEQLFRVQCKRLGLNQRRFEARPTFRRPHQQQGLFEARKDATP